MKESPKTLQQAIRYFSDEQLCIDTVAKLRWPNGPVCVACGHKEHYYLKTQKRWKCKDCHKQFSVKLGTIFEDSPIGLDKWQVALWMLVNCRNGISSYEVARALGITQKSAWFVLHRLRLAMQNSGSEPFGGVGQIVEADESFVGGKVSNMHLGKRAEIRRMRSEFIGDVKMLNKSTVMGILDRKLRKVRATVVKKVNKEALHNEIMPHIAPGSKIVTDEANIYRSIPKGYDHEFVNHMHSYVRGDVHTNGLENFWSLLKRGVKGSQWVLEQFTLTYHVTHPLHQVDGVSHAARGRGVCHAGQCDFLIAVPVKSFDSGDSNRDLHMLQVTRGGQFPMITLRTHLSEDASASATIRSDLEVEFAGQTPEFKQVPFQQVTQGNETRISGTIPATLSDFKIDPPSLLAMPVKNEIPVRVELTWQKQK